ncbi:polyketide synthase dehydratase domain-containing protein, partial [Micromonospora sp. DT31]|uniref:polyketide synthase dehydratase domain-containing protein n=1 Tax=Micromonospora sp. DT31 TaxID=3393434 RepID=UPI003CE7BAF5
PINWTHPPTPTTTLPTYPFHHHRYWATASADRAGGSRRNQHPLLHTTLDVADSDTVVVTGSLSTQDQSWLADHAIDGRIIVPATVFLDLTLHLATSLGHNHITELLIEQPLSLDEQRRTELQIVVTQPAADRHHIAVHSRPYAADESAQLWTRHVTGTLDTRTAAPVLTGPVPVDATTVDVAELYDGLAVRGYDYGPAFRLLTKLQDAPHPQSQFAEVHLPEGMSAAGHTIHPALLDSALHPLLRAANEATFIPFSCTDVTITGAAQAPTALRVQLRQPRPDHAAVTVTDEAGNPLIHIGDLALRPLPSAGDDATLHEVQWAPVTVTTPSFSGDEQWALVGSGDWVEPFHAALGELGITAQVQYDVETVIEMAGYGGAVPRVVVVDCVEPDDGRPVPDRVRAATHRVLDIVQAWLATAALADSRLVLLSSGAVGVGCDGGVVDVAGSAVWGFVRSV